MKEKIEIRIKNLMSNVKEEIEKGADTVGLTIEEYAINIGEMLENTIDIIADEYAEPGWATIHNMIRNNFDKILSDISPSLHEKDMDYWETLKNIKFH